MFLAKEYLMMIGRRIKEIKKPVTQTANNIAMNLKFHENNQFAAIVTYSLISLGFDSKGRKMKTLRKK